MPNIFESLFVSGGRAKVWRIFSLIMLLVIVGLLIVGGGYYNRGANWIANKTGQAVKLPSVKETPFRLGLDLLGGTQLVYQADVSAVPGKDQPSAVEGVRDVIERRINVFGVAEPNIQTNLSGGKYFVMVELAGIKDSAQAIKMIGETPLLEFKEQNTEKRAMTGKQTRFKTD